MGCGSSQPKAPEEWTHLISIKTGDKKGADTDGNIYIILRDGKGFQTNDTKIDTKWHDDFESGALDSFHFNFPGIGKPTGLIIKRDDTASDDAWYVEKIVVECESGDQAVFPVHRWVHASTQLSVQEFDCSLPQFDENANQRVKELERKKGCYALKSYVEGAPAQVAVLPADEAFSNQYAWDIDALKKKAFIHTKFIDFATPKFTKLKDFEGIYKGEILTKPYGIENWESDEEFGNQRLSGCNPTMIQLCTEIPEHMPVSAAVLERFLEGLTLKDALNQKKIYYVDLRYLAAIKCSLGRKLPGPTAVFYSNKKGSLVPIAIQLMPKPSEDNPVFTPETGDLKYTWLVAKMWFNLADASHHQSVTHLGFTHLVMESVAVCTHRQISPSHPIFKLLAPHYIYLLAINTNALNKLVSEGGWVDTTMHIGRVGMFNIIKHNWKQWNIQEYGNLIGDLKRRGVDDTKALPNYHYRDDALLLWKALEKYVAHVVDAFYDTPEKLTDDDEIQGWATELSASEMANVKGVPGMFSNNDELIEVVTCIIFVASVGHAAANFCQYDEYAFPPNYPAMLYGTPPASKAPLAESDVVALLPNKKMCLSVMIVTKILSERGTNELTNFEVQYAYDPVTLCAQKQLKVDLANIAKKIDARNASRTHKYPYLHPNSVPNAISI